MSSLIFFEKKKKKKKDTMSSAGNLLSTLGVDILLWRKDLTHMGWRAIKSELIIIIILVCYMLNFRICIITYLIHKGHNFIYTRHVPLLLLTTARLIRKKKKRENLLCHGSWNLSYESSDSQIDRLIVTFYVQFILPFRASGKFDICKNIFLISPHPSTSPAPHKKKKNK